jgi:NADPH-dependent ferric siderophore reductase
MASAKAIFGATLGRFFFRSAEVTAVREVGSKMRLVDFAGADLRGVEWTPGDKVQVFIGAEGMRTYTPLRWDRENGVTTFLLYVHSASTPGAAWAAKLRAGDRCQFFGPRRSIAFPELADHVVLVGDETSFAAACALRDVRPSTYIFEVDNDARETLDAVGLADAITIKRRPNGAHLDELAERVKAELEAKLTASLAMTGRAQTIQRLRETVRRPGKTKAYWSVGKAGLD